MIQPCFPAFMPESNWRPPTHFPEIGGAKWLSIDTETRDPHLQAKGPGFIRGDASVAGVAVHTDGFSGYFPVRHAQGDNIAPNIVFRWLSDVAKEFRGQMYGAHLLYDLEALHFENVDFHDDVVYCDIQVAEPLIDEESPKGYSLEQVSQKYLGEGKDESLLREASARYSKGWTSKTSKRPIPFDPKSDLWMLPAEYVGAYAEADVDRPRRIFQDHQSKVLDKEELWPIFTLERKLIRPLLKMRLDGVPVDVEKAHALVKLLSVEIDKYSMRILKLVGFDPNVDSGQDLIKAYNVLHFKFPELNILSRLKRTAIGNPSFTADWTAAQDDPLSKAIARKKKLMTLRDDFVVGDILKEHVNGKLHPQFHQLRDNDRGTRTGRMSSTNPNGQQVPARHDEDFWGKDSPNWAELVRSLFVAIKGKIFSKNDFSQQEPRLGVHFATLARLPGAEIAAEAFRKNPKQDYHQLTTDIVNAASGKTFKRKRIKAINLGIWYGMGLDKLCRQLSVTQDEGAEILRDYHIGLPFVRALSNKCMDTAAVRGFLRTLLGRHQRFNLWEPVASNKEERDLFRRLKGLPRDQAEAMWPNRRLQRAGLHKAVNKLIQGSAADQTKAAMNILYYDHNRLTLGLAVHDELSGEVDDVSVARTVKQTMETCVQLVIPVVAESTVGPSWGEAHEEILLEAA